jgi:hypothetical protein
MSPDSGVNGSILYWAVFGRVEAADNFEANAIVTLLGDLSQPFDKRMRQNKRLCGNIGEDICKILGSRYSHTITFHCIEVSRVGY